jgi:hypothetical protein
MGIFWQKLRILFRKLLDRKIGLKYTEYSIPTGIVDISNRKGEQASLHQAMVMKIAEVRRSAAGIYIKRG